MKRQGPALSASKCVLNAFCQCTIGKDRVEFFMAPITELLATESSYCYKLPCSKACQQYLRGSVRLMCFAAFGKNQRQTVLQYIFLVSVY